MPATPELIHKFFETYGWQFEYEPATHTWHTGFRGDSNNFNIVVQLTSNWLYFAINPLVNCPRDELCAGRLHHHLLRLNHIINMAKFSVDSEGDVVLTVELPTENLDYSEFADGLNALSYYADEHYVDILNVAQNADYEPTLPDEDDEGREDDEDDEESETDLGMN